jgi:hypothetical protein
MMDHTNKEKSEAYVSSGVVNATTPIFIGVASAKNGENANEGANERSAFESV